VRPDERVDQRRRPPCGRAWNASASPPWLSPGAFWDHALLALKRAVEEDVALDLSELAAWRRPGTAAHSTSKDALRSLTRTLASELADRGVRVNAVNPGTIATDSHYLPQDAMAERLTRIADAVPMKRLGRPEEVAAVVAFLASADASYITGQAINIDGGMG
jgi:NAD(P)-dependent dehydrogenase (short-subunit alcohol dehydrogenase family)